MPKNIEVLLTIVFVAVSSYLWVSKESVPLKAESQKPKFWLYNEKSKYNVFDTIERVILKLGYERKDEDTSSPDMMKYDWELLWSYPYFSPNVSLNVVDFTKLKPNQKLNHFPGNFHFINKFNLAKFTNSKYVPKGFSSLPDLQKFAKDNPDTRYVQKNYANRGISLKTASDIDFSVHGKGGNFAQVFIENPLLIEGFKFDIMVYVGISAVNPLRVYYYEENCMFRFCSIPYDSKNFSDTRSYVIDDNHLHGNMFKPFDDYQKMGFSYKETFLAIMRKNGRDMTKVFEQIEDCILKILTQKEHLIMREIDNLKPTKGRHHFFELVRFDFMADDKLNVHLMEINQNPNLLAVGKNAKHKKIYENVLYDFLSMIGVGTYIEKKKIHDFSGGEHLFMGDSNHISVNPENCTTKICMDSCESPNCRLCWKCMPEPVQWDLRLAFIEHSNIGQMKRVVPPPNEILKNLDGEYWKNLTPKNRLYAEWLIEMCKKNKRFC